MGDSNQTEFDLKNIVEYCEHLTADIVLNMIQYIVKPFTLANILCISCNILYKIYYTSGHPA